MPRLVLAITILAAIPPTDPAWRRAIAGLSVAIIIALVTILLVGVVGLMLIRRHRRKLLRQPMPRRRKRPPPDPWFESARRVPKPNDGPKSRIFDMPGPGDSPADGSDDDTVDIDPGDLDHGDIEGADDEPPSPSSRGG